MQGALPIILNLLPQHSQESLLNTGRRLCGPATRHIAPTHPQRLQQQQPQVRPQGAQFLRHLVSS
jgi:hypothetical protein